MKKRELTIEHHGRCVDGYFYEPDTKEYPLIIMSHGYNGHKSDFDISAEYFANNGIGAVCYTFCGGSVRDERICARFWTRFLHGIRLKKKRYFCLEVARED